MTMTRATGAPGAKACAVLELTWHVIFGEPLDCDKAKIRLGLAQSCKPRALGG